MMRIPLCIEALGAEDTYDVVVVGAGGGGLAAALFAADMGQRVLVVERTEFVGGTTALSGGTLWIPNSQQCRQASLPDSCEDAAEYLRQTVGEQTSEELRNAFLRNGPLALARLEEISALKFVLRPHYPDYFPGAKGFTSTGRALGAVAFDGKRLGQLLHVVRPPIPEFTVFGGMAVDRSDVQHLLCVGRSAKSFLHVAKLLSAYAWDRLTLGRSARLVLGGALIGGLLDGIARAGVDLLLRTRVNKIEMREGRVSSVEVEAGSTIRRLNVSKGLILASGGFNRSHDLRSTLLPNSVPIYSATAEGTTGEMHRMATAIGAAHSRNNRTPAFWAPVSCRRRADGSTAVFPHLLLDRGKPRILAVNASGRRFVNEAVSYHAFVNAMFANDGGCTNVPAFLVTDSEGLRRYGLGLVRPRTRRLSPLLRDGYLTRASTLRELALKLGIDPMGLVETVERMNASAEKGSDSEFRRGDDPYGVFLGDAEHRPNPCLGPLDTPPFFAVRLYPGDIGAATGLRTDARARVLGRDSKPIDGLYACGNDMSSVMGGAYAGPGITLGPAIAFAFVAARDAVSSHCVPNEQTEEESS